jgi:hypothetical protein
MNSDGSKRSVCRLTAFGGVFSVVKDGAAAAPELDPCPRETLERLLHENRKYSPRLSGTLSNHLSMALESLYLLGASQERLLDFFAKYRSKLCPDRFADEADPGGDWRASVGDPKAYSRLRAAFLARLLSGGRDALLREVLPTALEGPATEAFHGMIRTAFAVRFEDDRDLPPALAYWIAHLEPLRAATSPRKRRDAPLAVFAACTSRRDQRRRTSVGGIMRAMRTAAARPEFLEYAGALDPAPGNLEKMADAAVRFYLASGGLTSLHAVTGIHAFRLLRPWIDKNGAAETSLFRALLAAYLAAGAPTIVDSHAATVGVDWKAVAHRAVASDDEHDIKFAFTCREEERAYGGTLHRRAAVSLLGIDARG